MYLKESTYSSLLLHCLFSLSSARFMEKIYSRNFESIWKFTRKVENLDRNECLLLCTMETGCKKAGIEVAPSGVICYMLSDDSLEDLVSGVNASVWTSTASSKVTLTTTEAITEITITTTEATTTTTEAATTEAVIPCSRQNTGCALTFPGVYAAHFPGVDCHFYEGTSIHTYAEAETNCGILSGQMVSLETKLVM